MTAIRVTGHEPGVLLVRVEKDDRTWDYEVEVSEEEARRLGGEPAEVARATLAFLLDREPPDSILARFGPATVRGYFPEYDRELPDYLAGPGAR
jgi:hypothetical protein